MEGKGRVAGPDRVKTTMTGPETGFLQPKKFQVMGATTQHTAFPNPEREMWMTTKVICCCLISHRT
jgi:hypothetical protein